MEVVLLEEAKNDLHKMDNSVFILFRNHLKMLENNPVQRHLQHGLDFYIKDIKNKKYKIVYTIEENIIYVERCFDDHKKYEKWYKSYRRKSK